MKNPWLDIPLSDYEGHMALPEVAQAQLLADVFAAQLEINKPRSLAMLGCAGGNGFERIDPEVTRRVVGVDLNGRYLHEVCARFGTKFERLARSANSQADPASDSPAPPAALAGRRSFATLQTRVD